MQAAKAGLLTDLPADPAQIAPQIKDAVAASLEADRSVHKANIQNQLIHEFTATDPVITYGDEPEEWVVDPATGLGRWRTVGPPVRVVPHVSEQRIAERAASRKPSSITKGEFRGEVLRAGEQTDVSKGLTLGGTSVSIDALYQDARKKQEAAERKRFGWSS